MRYWAVSVRVLCPHTCVELSRWEARWVFKRTKHRWQIKSLKCTARNFDDLQIALRETSQIANIFLAARVYSRKIQFLLTFLNERFSSIRDKENE